MTVSRTPSAAVTSFVVGSRYMPVYLALILLVVVASIWAPATLSSAGLKAIAPMGTFLAITALGQMLVIMTGGIDLSVPGTFLLGGLLMVGVGQQSDERIWIAYLTAIGVAAVIGLLNGILIGGLKLNPLIVTLAVGQIVIGIASRYYSTVAIQKPVPPGLSEWANGTFLGVTRLFWVGVALTVLLVIIFRFTAVGRRFQVVGANPVASTVMGLRVNLTQIATYVVAAILYATAGVLLAGFLRAPGVTVGAPYLLGPIAAVVIGGASLTGGLASPISTFAAAFFLAGLNQMMRVLSLPTALQFVVFGLVIVGGMLVSGDRIIKGVERVLRDRSKPSHREAGAWSQAVSREMSHQGGETDRHATIGGGRMRSRVLPLIAVLAFVLAACTGDVAGTTVAEEPVDDRGARRHHCRGSRDNRGDRDHGRGRGDNRGDRDDGLAADDLSAYGESTDADPALIEKALGPVELTDPIVLASIARAEQDLDEATITTAIECYNSTVGGGECETGTGGEVVMGYADGGGLNVWRQVTRMEAILQALTYEDIGTIVFRDAQWSHDPAVPIGDINFMVERGVDFIIGYPDWGIALGDAIKAAEAAGIPYMSYSAGWVGLPEQDGSLIPGEDYLGVVGEDLCSLGESFAGVINEGVGEGTIGVLGGTPGNALSLGWQQCHIPALGEGIDVINPPADENSTTGDTYWANDIARDVVSGWLSTNPDMAGFSYEYADGLYTALDVASQSTT